MNETDIPKEMDESPTLSFLQRIKALQTWHKEQINGSPQIYIDEESYMDNLVDHHSESNPIDPRTESNLSHLSEKSIENTFEENLKESNSQDVYNESVNYFNEERSFIDCAINGYSMPASFQQSSVNIVDKIPNRKFVNFLKDIDEDEPPQGESNLNFIEKRNYLKKGDGLRKFGRLNHMKLKKKISGINKCSSKTSQIPKHPVSKYKDSTNTKSNTDVCPIIENQIKNPNVYKNKGAIAKRLPIKNLMLNKKTKQEVKNIKNECRNNVKSPLKEPNDDIETTESQLYENDELSVFEHLEQLADNTSFSSNSSTVVKLLCRGLQVISSTPCKISNDDVQVNSCCKTSLLNKFQETESISNLPDSMHSVSEDTDVVKQVRDLLQNEEANPYTDEEILAAVQKLTPESRMRFLSELRCDNTIASPNNAHQVNSTNKFSKPTKVHFAPNAVHVLEYDNSDADTLTDAASILDESDIVNQHDLEAIMSNYKASYPSSCDDGETDIYTTNPNNILPSPVPTLQSDPLVFNNSIPLSDSTLHVENEEEKLILKYSPPRMPPNSASHHIWSVFAKDRPKMTNVQKLIPKNTEKPLEKNINKQSQVEQSEQTVHSAKIIMHENELKAEKILYRTKIKELEKEVNLYEENNAKFKFDQQNLFEDQQRLEKEQNEFLKFKCDEIRKLQSTIEEERKKNKI